MCVTEIPGKYSTKSQAKSLKNYQIYLTRFSLLQSWISLPWSSSRKNFWPTLASPPLRHVTKQPIRVSYIETLLGEIKCQKSCGPDNIMLKILKFSAPSIVASHAGVFRGARISSLPKKKKYELPQEATSIAVTWQSYLISALVLLRGLRSGSSAMWHLYLKKMMPHQYQITDLSVSCLSYPRS